MSISPERYDESRRQSSIIYPEGEQESTGTAELLVQDADGQGHDNNDAPYSIFTRGQKNTVLVISSACAFLSPTSASIYWPAFNSIASDLHVSLESINWTVTSYMIVQAIAPAFYANLTERVGRRPCFMLCLSVYFVSNIAIALQDNYIALLLLRCVQSFGGSPTVTLGSAAAADIASSAERGKYVSRALLGVALGPAVSPVLGGVLAQSFGWRSIFWFLTGTSGVILLAMLLFFPETARGIVGNGSIAPPRWNVPLWRLLWVSICGRRPGPPPPPPPPPFKSGEDQRKPAQNRTISIFAALRLLALKQTALIIHFGAIGNAASYFVTSAIPARFGSIYHLSNLKLGLCYLPGAAGSLLAIVGTGRLVDWNYRRLAHLHGRPVVADRQQELGNFPIEKARLQVALPLAYAACVAIVVYGWLLDLRIHIAGPCVFLFIIGFCNAGSLLVLPTLAMDLYPKSAAAVSAATNLSRCVLGAAATGASLVAIAALGDGWANTAVALIWALSSIAPCISLHYGPTWRTPGATASSSLLPPIHASGDDTANTVAAMAWILANIAPSIYYGPRWQSLA